MRNVLKTLGIIAITAIIGFSMITCDTGDTGDDTGGKKIEKSGKKDGPVRYVMDVSEISGWDILVFCEDGSSMVLKLDETTLMPTRAYVNPKKDSDNGFSIWFKTNGLPDLMVTNDHIVCYGNFDGYTFDMAVIKPNGEIEEHNNNQTDVNWDTFNEVLFQGNSGNARSIFDALRGGKNVKGEPIPFTLANVLDCIGTGAGLAACITAPLVPGAAIGCGIFLLSQVTGEVVQIATKDNDLASDIGGTLISALGCVTLDPWDCASTAVGLYSLIDDNAAKLINKAQNATEKILDATIGKMIEKKKYVAVTGVKLDKTAITLTAGGLGTVGSLGLERVIATVLPSNATRGYGVTYTSSNENVAKVSYGDYVCAVAEGTAVITVRTLEGNYKATCTVTVKPPVTVAVTGVRLDPITLSLAVGEHEELTGAVVPSNATNKNVEWSTSDKNIAIVSESGRVTGVAEGTASITVRALDGNYTASCAVTVTATLTEPPIIIDPNGTPGLAYEMINASGSTVESGGVAYLVRAGTVTSGEVYIPAYHTGADGRSLPVTQIGNASDYGGAFESTTITAVHFIEPSNVTSIKNYAFYKVKSLRQIDLPEGITSIERSAFYQCTSLVLTSLPAGLKTIGNYAFDSCTKLALTLLPAGVTYIGTTAFSSCTSLTQIVLPAGLTYIDTAFWGCAKLAVVTCLATIPPTMSGSNTFYDNSASLVIKVPAGSVSAYKSANNWKYYADKIIAIEE